MTSCPISPVSARPERSCPGFCGRDSRKPREITPAILAEAETVAGLEFTEEAQETMVQGLNQILRAHEALRAQTNPRGWPRPGRRPPGIIGGTRRSLPPPDHRVAPPLLRNSLTASGKVVNRRKSWDMGGTRS